MGGGVTQEAAVGVAGENDDEARVVEGQLRKHAPRFARQDQQEDGQGPAHIGQVHRHKEHLVDAEEDRQQQAAGDHAVAQLLNPRGRQLVADQLDRLVVVPERHRRRVGGAARVCHQQHTEHQVQEHVGVVV